MSDNKRFEPSDEELCEIGEAAAIQAGRTAYAAVLALLAKPRPGDEALREKIRSEALLDCCGGDCQEPECIANADAKADRIISIVRQHDAGRTKTSERVARPAWDGDRAALVERMAHAYDVHGGSMCDCMAAALDVVLAAIDTAGLARKVERLRLRSELDEAREGDEYEPTGDEPLDAKLWDELRKPHPEERTGTIIALVRQHDAWQAAHPPQQRPVCAQCNDTHLVYFESRGREVMCTSCPTPCQECRAGGNGAYCETTPCPCGCHAKEAQR